MLQQKRLLEEAAWSNPQIDQFLSETEEGGLAVTLYDLVRTLQVVLERAKNRPVYEVDKEDVTVPDMIRYLNNVFQSRARDEAVSARVLFEQQRGRRGMICLFLAILELVRMQALRLVQKQAFGEIFLKRHKRFDEVLASEEMIAAIQAEYH